MVHWHDNNIVTTVSNKVDVAPPQTAKRWSKAEAKRVEIAQPFIVELSLWSTTTRQLEVSIGWPRMWTSTTSPFLQRSGSGHCLLSEWMSVSSRHGTCTGQHQQLRPNHLIFLLSGVPGSTLLVPHKHLSLVSQEDLSWQ